MIITLTPNPTIDRVYYLPSLEPNTVHRAIQEVATPSGKGVDASIILQLLGEPTVALGFNAGEMGRVLGGYLDAQGVPHDFVEAHGETRTVPVLVDTKRGTEYTITAPTLFATDEQFVELLNRIGKYATTGWGLIAAGSLPPGIPSDGYARIVEQSKAANLFTLLDTSGESLRQGIKALPHLLKINHAELADIDGEFAAYAVQINASDKRPVNLSEFAQALSAQLGTLASEAIIISMGKRGVLAITNTEATYAGALSVPVGVTNGAGDAMDTGIMLALMRGQGWIEALRLGTAMAAAAVMHEGTAGLDPANVDELLPQVQVETL
ncbi:MAG: hexose kinase [Chloroflexota bacterium]